MFVDHPQRFMCHPCHMEQLETDDNVRRSFKKSLVMLRNSMSRLEAMLGT